MVSHTVAGVECAILAVQGVQLALVVVAVAGVVWVFALLMCRVV